MGSGGPTIIPPIMVIVKLFREMTDEYPELFSSRREIFPNAFTDAENITPGDMNRIFRDVLAELR